MGSSQRFVLEDGFDLRALHAGKPREKLFNGRAIAEIFKQRGQRHWGASKYPHATQLLRVTLHRITILPVLHTLLSCSIPGNQRTKNTPNSDIGSRCRSPVISSPALHGIKLYTLSSADSFSFFPAPQAPNGVRSSRGSVGAARSPAPTLKLTCRRKRERGTSVCWRRSGAVRVRRSQD